MRTCHPPITRAAVCGAAECSLLRRRASPVIRRAVRWLAECRHVLASPRRIALPGCARGRMGTVSASAGRWAAWGSRLTHSIFEEPFGNLGARVVASRVARCMHFSLVCLSGLVGAARGARAT